MLRYLLYCGGLEPTLQYLWGTPVFTSASCLQGTAYFSLHSLQCCCLYITQIKWTHLLHGRVDTGCFPLCSSVVLHFVSHLTLHWGWAAQDPHFCQNPILAGPRFSRRQSSPGVQGDGLFGGNLSRFLFLVFGLFGIVPLVWAQQCFSFFLFFKRLLLFKIILASFKRLIQHIWCAVTARIGNPILF